MGILFNFFLKGRQLMASHGSSLLRAGKTYSGISASLIIDLMLKESYLYQEKGFDSTLGSPLMAPTPTPTPPKSHLLYPNIDQLLFFFSNVHSLSFLSSFPLNQHSHKTKKKKLVYPFTDYICVVLLKIYKLIVLKLYKTNYTKKYTTSILHVFETDYTKIVEDRLD